MNDSDIQKRLEVIKNLIILGDLDLVRVQIEKLKKQTGDEGLSPITRALENHEFFHASQLINDYLKRTQEANSELPALRMQVQALEIALAEKQSIKVDLERTIHHFYTSYQAELGEYILQVLDLRRQVKPEEATPKQQDFFAKANKEYDNYKKIFDTMDKEQVPLLTPDMHKDMRLTFLRASKLCHPDVVADEFKEQAELIFVELKEAYENYDMARILDILGMLEQGAMTVKSSQITDLDKLKTLVVTLKSRIQSVNKEIERLKDSETYRTLSGVKDWEQYLNTMRLSLIKEIQVLRTRAHG